MSEITVYAAVSDITALGHSLSAAQQEAAERLIEYASARLRVIARKVGKNIDALIADEDTGKDYALAVKYAVVQVVSRALDSMDAGTGALTQGSQTLGAYSVQMTYYNPGQICYFTRNELRELGLYHAQTYGAVELWASKEEET